MPLECPSDLLDFDTVYRNYYKRVYNYIYGQIFHHEVAEDLTADVFVAVATHLGHFDPARGSLTTWIFTIARHLTQNHIHRAATRMEESCENLPERPATGLNAYDDSLRSPENVRVERILAQLSNEEQRFLEYRYVLDLSNEEIGRITGLTAATVSQRYHRLLAKCRNLDRDV